jgi:hypothetical protein
VKAATRGDGRRQVLGSWSRKAALSPILSGGNRRISKVMIISRDISFDFRYTMSVLIFLY